MSSNYLTDDPIQGQIDLDDKFITDAWLVDQFVGGTLFESGRNHYGQLGNGTTINYSSPIQIGSLTNWSQVSCGYSRSFAKKTDGTLWAWGLNSSGSLGIGNTINYSSPVQIGALTNWQQVSCSKNGYFTLSVKTDGTLWAWGANAQGQLGNGATNAYSSPIQVGLLSDWKQVVTAGGDYMISVAIKNNGTLWSWGGNGYGELGNGTVNTYYSSPIQIGSLTNWKQVSCSFEFLSAVKTDGTLWAWGFNKYGQLGNGTVTNYSSPIQVGSLTNWKQVACGYGSIAAVKTDGTLWAWGFNKTGQLGNGTVVYYSSPIQIGALTNWKQVACGYDQNSAIKTDGTLWVWGNNGYGQLGNGTTINYSSPVQVGSLTNWKQVHFGVGHSMMITYKDLG